MPLLSYYCWSRLYTTRNSSKNSSSKKLLRFAVATTLALNLLSSSSSANHSSVVAAAMSTASKPRVIDSHLHVWANEEQAAGGFPYAEGQTPPGSLRNVASTQELLRSMDTNGVDGALIVQPINHKFDHSYVIKAIQQHPRQLKGMFLFDPSLSVEEGITRLEDLSLKGFVGVRFNPYLWPKLSSDSDTSPKWTPISTPGSSGLAVYQRCADLKMPVGIMCFQGLQYHYEDILELIRLSPDTVLILDHFGFTSLTTKDDENDDNGTFEKLLSLAQYKNVNVKISALFRLKDDDTKNYQRVKTERFLPLLEAFGSNRLMFGTDFPYVLEQPPSYGGTVQLISSWVPNDEDRVAIMGGTAERLFGPWASIDDSCSSDKK